ncbi:hypothetical protein ColTof3_06481 [Colletotrichum tofieldiae]|nr:hypothetical protein ColTof3_06481 [Colletotrichum tofieldiae]
MVGRAVPTKPELKNCDAGVARSDLNTYLEGNRAPGTGTAQASLAVYIRPRMPPVRPAARSSTPGRALGNRQPVRQPTEALLLLGAMT